MQDHSSFEGDKFALYEGVIDRYRERFPKEWAAFLQVRDQNREQVKNDFGSLDEGAFRFTGSMPAELDKMLRAACKLHKMDEDYLNKEFLEKFPVFLVAKKI